jgi:hypothetical protein
LNRSELSLPAQSFKSVVSAAFDPILSSLRRRAATIEAQRDPGDRRQWQVKQGDSV